MNCSQAFAANVVMNGLTVARAVPSPTPTRSISSSLPRQACNKQHRLVHSPQLHCQIWANFCRLGRESCLHPLIADLPNFRTDAGCLQHEVRVPFCPLGLPLPTSWKLLASQEMATPAIEALTKAQATTSDGRACGVRLVSWMRQAREAAARRAAGSMR